MPSEMMVPCGLAENCISSPFFAAGIGISSSNHGRNGKPPCVGLCYYEKLMDLQGKNAAEKEPNQTIQVSLLQHTNLELGSWKTESDKLCRERTARVKACARRAKWNI